MSQEQLMQQIQNAISAPIDKRVLEMSQINNIAASLMPSCLARYPEEKVVPMAFKFANAFADGIKARGDVLKEVLRQEALAREAEENANQSEQRGGDGPTGASGEQETSGDSQRRTDQRLAYIGAPGVGEANAVVAESRLGQSGNTEESV